MRKSFITIGCAIVICAVISTGCHKNENNSQKWMRTFGGKYTDCGYSVQQTSDGGYIIAGYTASFGAGWTDVYLIKTDANGNTVWTKTFGGSGEEMGYSAQQTTDGGYIIVGYTSSFGAGGDDVYLIKTDENGNQVWTKTFGGTGNDCGYSVQQTSDGGFIIAGRTNILHTASSYIYLIKTDANGDTSWTKTFSGTYDNGYSVEQISDGGYIILGTTSLFGYSESDVYLIKTDSNGNTIWAKTFGGTYSDDCYSVQQTSDNGFIIAGQTYSYGAGRSDVYLIKTDENGNQIWTKTFGGTNYDCGYSVQQTSDGGYIIAGYTYSYGTGDADVYLIKTDANGNRIWYNTFGRSYWEEAYSVQQTSDGGYIIAGYTHSYGAGGGDVYLIKTDASGHTE